MLNPRFVLFYFYFYAYSFLQKQKFKKQNTLKIYTIVNENNEMDNLRKLIDSNNKIDDTNIIDNINNEIMDEIKTKKTDYYKRIKGYDERFCLELYDIISCKESYNNNIIILKKIYGYLQKKQMLEKLTSILQSKKEYETLHYLFETNIIEEIQKYNNDNRNTSIFIDNLISGDLFHDW
jgi:hypothetical protein